MVEARFRGGPKMIVCSCTTPPPSPAVAVVFNGVLKAFEGAQTVSEAFWRRFGGVLKAF